MLILRVNCPTRGLLFINPDKLLYFYRIESSAPDVYPAKTRLVLEEGKEINVIEKPLEILTQLSALKAS